MGDLFAELRRRKVVRVAVVYGIVAFAVIEAADIMGPALNLPPEFITFVVAAALLGYPIAIVLAWAYEIVPDAVAKQAESATYPDSVTGGRPKPGATGFRLAVALGLLAVAILGWQQYRSTVAVLPERPAYAYIDSVAVMPLDNLTGDASYDHVGIGITEEIITQLASIPPLKVISRHSVQAVSGQNLTVPQLSNALSVRHVIEGSVRLDGEGLLVTVQHINAETDAHIWAQSFRAASDDVIGLQEDVASQVASRIVLAIPGLPQPNPNSHMILGPGQQAYLQGKRWLGQRTADGIGNSIERFTEAIELDPGYAPAYADLSSALALALFYRYEVGMDEYTMAARSLAMSERALALDPNLAAGYAARGYLGALIGQPAGAVAADFNRAALLQPNAASIPSWRARSLAQLGNFEEAVSEAGRAIELDPLAPARYIALAELSLQIGEYDEAISAAKMATTLEPRQIRSRAIEARAMLLSDHAEGCARMTLGPHKILRATCLDAMGNETDGRAIVSETLEALRTGSMTQAQDGYSTIVIYEDLAVDYAWRGDAEQALEWAARAYGKSPVGLEIRVLESELFDAVRDDPEFDRAIKEIRGGIYARVLRDSAQYLPGAGGE